MVSSSNGAEVEVKHGVSYESGGKALRHAEVEDTRERCGAAAQDVEATQLL